MRRHSLKAFDTESIDVNALFKDYDKAKVTINQLIKLFDEITEILATASDSSSGDDDLVDVNIALQGVYYSFRNTRTALDATLKQFGSTGGKIRTLSDELKALEESQGL